MYCIAQICSTFLITRFQTARFFCRLAQSDNHGEARLVLQPPSNQRYNGFWMWKKNIANIRDVETSLIFELTLIIIKHIILSFENRPRCVGSAGSLLFGIWAICSTLIFMCFTCNLNAILFTPSYESRVDTACQVLEHQLVKDSTKNTC